MPPHEEQHHDDFLRLFAVTEPALRAFVRSLVPRREDVPEVMPEVMQEVAVVLWRKFGDLAACGDFRKWAFGVARLEALAWARDKARDRHALDLKITVELSQPAVIYVMHDVRKPPPDWLAEDFADTGMCLRSGPWRPEGRVVQDVGPDETGQYFLRYSIWRKEVSVAGSVELGPPHLRGQGGPSAMYGVAVKLLPQPVGKPEERKP